MKLSLGLLHAAALVPLASADYETVFTFKDDFFLKFCDQSFGMGPADGVALLDGLDEKANVFKAVWEEEIKKLQDGDCEVVGVSISCSLVVNCDVSSLLFLIVWYSYLYTFQDVPTPKFSYCEWKYPDRYDILRLPLAGQCHEHSGEMSGGGECYIQRLFYKIKDLKVRCQEKLPIKDLNRSDLLETALEEMISDLMDTNVVDPEGPWEEALSVEEVDSNDECNALLSINRYTKIEVDLKCLKEEFTTEKADMLKVALDEYFEEYAVPKIKDAVESVTPQSAVYSVKSPYDKDGDTVYCYYPSYYDDGSLVDQYEAGDGNIVTKFKCGFDIVWFKDKGFSDSDSLLPDLVETVQNVFIADTPPFLPFLQNMYPNEAWVQNTQECGVVDPNNIDPPTSNPTASPTADPTKSPTNVPTTSPTQEPTAVVCIHSSISFCFATLLNMII